ncbi:MAG: molybdopterin-binding protein [Bradyrhizobiaceae bacterium]|nr:molybdopterin-binding protein [Bradyrhizobiaceae bacterium]
MSPPTEALQRITRLAPLPDVLARIEAVVRPVAPRDIDPAGAVGATLAADAVAPADLPPAAIAVRDGWAVAAEQVADAGPYAPVLLSPAPPWVETGERMPPGTDAILPLDAVAVTKTGAEAHGPAVPGEGVLPAGADAARGDVLRREGARLRPGDAAILRAAGIASLGVRWPRVKIFCASVPTRSAADTLSPLLARAIEAEGCVAEVAQASSLESALLDRACDAVVTVGGTGSGRRDASVKTLARVGRVEVHGIGIAPGETAAFGMIDARPVLMLPGRLDAALAAFLMVGHPLLRRLAACTESDIKIPVRLARKIASTVGLAEAVFARHTGSEAEPLGTGLFSLAALVRANGWVLVPPESEGFSVGAAVDMRLLP